LIFITVFHFYFYNSLIFSFPFNIFHASFAILAFYLCCFKFCNPIFFMNFISFNLLVDFCSRVRCWISSAIVTLMKSIVIQQQSSLHNCYDVSLESIIDFVIFFHCCLIKDLVISHFCFSFLNPFES
jgi:hypothetical protein